MRLTTTAKVRIFKYEKSLTSNINVPNEYLLKLMEVAS